MKKTPQHFSPTKCVCEHCGRQFYVKTAKDRPKFCGDECEEAYEE